MGLQTEALRTQVLEAVAARLEGDLATFARALFSGLSRADLSARTPEDLVACARSLWDFAEQRQPGEAKLRVVRPDPRTSAWLGTPLLVEIVNDDMPFLVDTVTSALSTGRLAADLTVDIILHPIVRVTRDAAGHRSAYGDGKAESVMQIGLGGTVEDEDFPAIEASLAQALKDTRAAVQDWRAMLHRLSLITAELDDPALASAPISAGEVEETKAFLTWLADNHMTLLGYREYVFDTVDGETVMKVTDDSGLGILRDPDYSIFDGIRTLSALPPEVRAFLESPTLLTVTKANQRATVHRPVHMDVVAIKKLDATGKVIAERRFVGLFTGRVYNDSPSTIPVLRQKIDHVVTHAGLSPNSHDGKALMQILETYPRDELFQIDPAELFETAMAVLQLQDRRRIALFTRRDPFARYVSCLVYIPRDRYDNALRERFHAILAEGLGGRISASYIQLSESPLARLHIIVKTNRDERLEFDSAEIERRLVEAGRGWVDQIQSALGRITPPSGTTRGGLLRRFMNAFPAAYREKFTGDEAVADIPRILSAGDGDTVFWVYRRPDAADTELSFKIFRTGQPVALSDVLPMLENRGLRVLSETPFKLRPLTAEGQPAPRVWLHDFDLVVQDKRPVALEDVRERFHAAFAATWNNRAEDDGFNRLILAAGLDWREIVILRAYAKYLKQAGLTYSQSYLEQALANQSAIASLLVALFHARFNPATADEVRAAGIVVEIEHALDAVTALDEDRILRRYLNLILATLRTNFYQVGADGLPKAYVSFKLDSGRIDDLPKPRPLYEIWVYSPDVEAVHLRGGKVARGGIRWSDRREDFRTEILGLLKAQTVKNAVIVPVGSKGGFFVKRPLPPEAGRPAVLAHAIECYKTMMRGLLDITDNRKEGAIVPPPNVVRHDPDDPYLVVAADKGTATFSDIANSVSRDYGFWLDDAFASGGSAGYDHKALGITARGAWVAVERHLREAGIDLRQQEISVIGIGDMAGDVFGNGLIHSDKLRLVGAFNHMHIFIDPTPDAARTFEERKRMFALPSSTWKDYDASLISKGGAIFERSAKILKLTPEIQTLFGIEREQITPADLIQAMLKAQVDLLWFGGIGTYIKAQDENNAGVGDRANDALRIDGRELRARVIGEGANLGATQRGRIEAALAGVRLNTDAIDNSAGVDCSDHEVNIKILLGDPVQRGDLDIPGRDTLVASMATEVCDHVLRDNYLQTFALSAAQHEGGEYIDTARRLMDRLEKEVALDRSLESLPNAAQLDARRAAGLALVRPELAPLLAWSKIAVYNKLLPSAVIDDPALNDDLIGYFPPVLGTDYREVILRHGLRREIIATVLTNEMVNRGGIALLSDLEAETGASIGDLTRAYAIARGALDLPTLWASIEALDGQGAAADQLALYRASSKALETAMRWVLRQSLPGSIGDALAALSPAIARLRDGLASDASVAGRVAALGQLVQRLDVLAVAEAAGVEIDRAGAVFATAGQRLGFDGLRAAVATAPAGDGWTRAALTGLAGDFARLQETIARQSLAHSGGFDGWLAERGDSLKAADSLLADLAAQPGADLARLTVAERALRALTV